MVDTKKKAMIALVLSLVLLLPLSLLYLQLSGSHDEPTVTMTWGIEEETILVYEIEASGYYQDTYPVQGEGVPTIAVALDGQTVVVSVVDLPLLNSSIPISEFMNHGKPVCVSSFYNGSEIPESFEAVLSTIVSYAITPLTNWSILDAEFPDNYTGGISPNEEHLFTRMEGNLFYLMYVIEIYSGGHFGLKTFESKVNMTTGVPAFAAYHYSYSLSVGSYSVSIRLTSCPQ